MIKIVPDKEGKLTQWDLNRKVIVTGYEGVAEVHFASPGDDHGAYVVELIDGEAKIPNILLTIAGTINVYVYPADRTVFATALWVMAREKPDDYVYTETEVLNWRTLDEKIGNLAELTTTAKENLVAAINEAATKGMASIYMRVADGYIEYSGDGVSWKQLIAVAELKGDKGDKGDPGSDATVEIVTPTAESTDAQAASAKAVYDAIQSISSSGSSENTSYIGHTGILYFDNGNVHAYNPIVNTTAQNARCQKLSRLIQDAANDSLLASSPETLAHECAIDGNGYMTWVENTAGTSADVPGIDGITCVKGRKYTISSINNYNFPDKVPEFWGDTVTTIAQKGDIATNTLNDESFELQGGVGYQTLIDGKVICGYVPAYAKVAGLTCELSSSGGVISVSSRKTWTLSIDGTVGEYNYNRLPAGLTGATLHPSNQIAKINSTYYRADVVPNNGFVVFSSTDLINWTYLGHATFPKGFNDMSEVEACCGAKRSRLYVAVRQKSENGCLYLAKMNTDMITINSCVALPDCGSKPCFTTEFSSGSKKTRGILLATAPANRYGCRVYSIPTNYDMSHIYPMFEIQNNACNYPFIANVGGLTLIAGTNGAQTDKNGVSILPIGVYTNAYSPELPSSTDNYVFTVDGAVAYGDLYETDGISLGLTGAAVGDIIKVKAVDESGKPTEWEAAGLPSSSGKAKSQILIDQEITELTASLSVTLEHNFHNITAIINCGSDGAALTANSDGTAVASKIALLIDTTSWVFNPRKVVYTDTSTATWKTSMIGAEWSDDLSVFKRGFAVELATAKTQQYYFPFGGSTAMYGTLGTNDNAPRTGKTANIVVNGAYLNIGTKVVLWGEYYE